MKLLTWKCQSSLAAMAPPLVVLTVLVPVGSRDEYVPATMQFHGPLAPSRLSSRYPSASS